MLKQVQVSQANKNYHRKSPEEKIRQHEIAKKVLNDKVMTVYKPGSDSKVIDVIRNESTMKFMIAIMTTSKRVDSFLNYAKDITKTYAWPKGFHNNSTEFVRYMNKYFLTKDGQKVNVSAYLSTDTEKPGWVAESLNRILQFAIINNYNVRSFPGLTQLQLRRCFYILRQMTNATSEVGPKFKL